MVATVPNRAELRRKLEARIQQRELQLASYGVEAPPYIVTDLEEARRGLAALDALEPPPVSREVQEVISAVPQPERDRANFLAILDLNAQLAELKRVFTDYQTRDQQERIDRQRDTDRYRVDMEQRLGNVRAAILALAVAIVLGWLFRRRG